MAALSVSWALVEFSLRILFRLTKRNFLTHPRQWWCCHDPQIPEEDFFLPRESVRVLLRFLR